MWDTVYIILNQEVQGTYLKCNTFLGFLFLFSLKKKKIIT